MSEERKLCIVPYVVRLSYIAKGLEAMNGK